MSASLPAIRLVSYAKNATSTRRWIRSSRFGSPSIMGMFSTAGLVKRIQGASVKYISSTVPLSPSMKSFW